METLQKPPTPKLTCAITGIIRPSNDKYLIIKSQQRGVSVQCLKDNYACKRAVKLLRAGHSVQSTRDELGVAISTPVSDDQVQQIISLNGKIKQ